MELYDNYRKLYRISGMCNEIIVKEIDNGRYLILYVKDYTRNEKKIYPFDNEFYYLIKGKNNIMYDEDLNKLIKIRNDIIKICGDDVRIDYQKLCKIYHLSIEYKLDFDLLFLSKDDYLLQLHKKMIIFYSVDLLFDIKIIITSFYYDL